MEAPTRNGTAAPDTLRLVRARPPYEEWRLFCDALAIELVAV